MENNYFWAAQNVFLDGCIRQEKTITETPQENALAEMWRTKLQEMSKCFSLTQKLRKILQRAAIIYEMRD